MDGTINTDLALISIVIHGHIMADGQNWLDNISVTRNDKILGVYLHSRH